MQYYLGVCELDQIGVAVACPIVDINTETKKVVIYGGAIHFSKDSVLIENKKIFGIAVRAGEDSWEIPDNKAYMVSVSQEHGIIQFSNSIPDYIEIGGLILILPVHSCLTADALNSHKLLSGDLVDHMNAK